MEYAADSDTPSPVANEPVQIQLQLPGGAFTPVASGTTGSDGHFTISTTLPSGGAVRAVFAGDADHSPSSTNGWMLLHSNNVESRLVLDLPPGATFVQAAAARGWQRVTKTGPAVRLEADLGRVGTLHVRWRQEPTPASPPRLRVREAYFWDLRASGSTLTA